MILSGFLTFFQAIILLYGSEVTIFTISHAQIALKVNILFLTIF